MKGKLLLFIITCLLTFSSKAQVTTELTGLVSPSAICIEGNMMYYCSNQQIYSADLTQTPLTPQVLATPAPHDYMTGMAVYNNKLYYSNVTADKISYVDLSVSSPTEVDVVTGIIEHPQQITIIGDELYYITNYPTSIYKIDLTQTTPTPTLVYSSSGTIYDGFGLEAIGTTLYFTDLSGGQVYSMDLTQSPVTPTVITTSYFPSCLSVVGNQLYFNSYLLGETYKLDTTTNTVTTIATGVGYPVGLDYYNGKMYIIDYFNGKIFSTAVPLATDNMVKNTIAIYPNPATDFISIANLQEATTYEIYSVDGKQVLAGTIAPDTNIDVQTLAQGMYVVKTANGATQRIVKL